MTADAITKVEMYREPVLCSLSKAFRLRISPMAGL